MSGVFATLDEFGNMWIFFLLIITCGMDVLLCARSWSLFCLAGEKRKYNLSVSSLYSCCNTCTHLVTNAHRPQLRTGFEFCALLLIAN